jgi:hypothetical protein
MAQVFKMINGTDKVNRATSIESVGSGRIRQHADPLNLRPKVPKNLSPKEVNCLGYHRKSE